MDDGAKLYAQYLNGDDLSLENLVRIYGDGLVRFVYGFVKDSMTAEDIAEDTFATLIIKRKRFSPNASFKTYLYKIARNKCLDFLRYHRCFVPLDDLENVITSSDGNPDENVELCERKTVLYKCLQKLPKQYGSVLTLVYIEGFTTEETSKIMNQSVKQVYNLLARAKLSLKQLLINEGIKYENI